MNILAIESSCDETSIAILKDNVVLSNVVATQYFHAKYGGVIPELAAREHLSTINQITNESLKKANLTINEIDSVAVTSEPGLVGALLVGSNFAKGLAIKYNIPITPINHIEGHLYSGHLQDDTLGFPCISMVVSGGHTSIFLVDDFENYKVIGSTIDDAAGEAFDKIAKMLGLDYPGGVLIDKLSKKGNSNRFDFPRSMYHTNDYNFSFSGLKTSVRYFLQKNYKTKDDNKIDLNNPKLKDDINDIAASAQEAIVDVLVHKLIKACENYKIANLTISGGVSANSKLREKLLIETNKRNIKLVIPDITYCIDNAAMIGFIAYQKQKTKLSQNSNNVMNLKNESLKFTVNSFAIRAKNK